MILTDHEKAETLTSIDHVDLQYMIALFFFFWREGSTVVMIEKHMHLCFGHEMYYWLSILVGTVSFFSLAKLSFSLSLYVVDVGKTRVMKRVTFKIVSMYLRFGTCDYRAIRTLH
jgi:hypothetical protein